MLRALARPVNSCHDVKCISINDFVEADLDSDYLVGMREAKSRLVEERIRSDFLPQTKKREKSKSASLPFMRIKFAFLLVEVPSTTLSR